jgi:hypothetical protein
MRRIVVLLILAGVCQAQALPDAPSASRRTPKAFWVLTAAYGASVVADAETTAAFVQVQCVEGWNPWLYGKRPSRARFYAAAGAMAVSTVFASRKMVRSRKKLVRAAGWTLLAGMAQGHARGAIHNIGADCR